jgi:DHA3 family tetracycline resistance protein-like MFS transporter
MPILAGATGVFLIGVTLMLIMPETGFKPTPMEDRNTWGQMGHVFKEGIAAVRARPRLMTILGVGLFYGLYSEGFDRLWVKHFLDRFELPILFGSTEVAFFGIMRAVGTILTIIVVHYVEKRLDTSQPRAIGRTMLLITAMISGSIIGFAVSPLFGITIGLFLMIYVFRRVAMPLYTAWLNQKLDSGTRATVLSMSGQVDAIGQIAGGPGVGLVANLASVVAAITTSGLLLSPALFLIGRANAQSVEQVETESAAAD